MQKLCGDLFQASHSVVLWRNGTNPVHCEAYIFWFNSPVDIISRQQHPHKHQHQCQHTLTYWHRQRHRHKPSIITSPATAQLDRHFTSPRLAFAVVCWLFGIKIETMLKRFISDFGRREQNHWRPEFSRIGWAIVAIGSGRQPNHMAFTFRMRLW